MYDIPKVEQAFETSKNKHAQLFVKKIQEEMHGVAIDIKNATEAGYFSTTIYIERKDVCKVVRKNLKELGYKVSRIHCNDYNFNYYFYISWKQKRREKI